MGQKWYEKDLLGYGNEADVMDSAKVFADIALAAQDAATRVRGFEGSGSDVWGGLVADKVRELLKDTPTSLDRFSTAHTTVNQVLVGFSSELEQYMAAEPPLVARGQEIAADLAGFKALKATAVQQLRSQQSALDQLGSVFDDFSDDPEVRYYAGRIDELKDALKALESAFEDNRSDFKSAVERAVDAISKADDVLYNNKWGEIFHHYVKPALEVLKIVVEIVGIALLIASFFIPGLNLATIALAAAIATASFTALEIAGTALAGEEVPNELWIEFAFDLASVAFAGAGVALSNTSKAPKAVKLVGGVQKARKLLSVSRQSVDVVHDVYNLENAKSGTESWVDGLVLGLDLVGLHTTAATKPSKFRVYKVTPMTQKRERADEVVKRTVKLAADKGTPALVELRDARSEPPTAWPGLEALGAKE